jgi:galactokinase
LNDFQTLFGRAPEVSASAPGRVNLIGEHTDYNDGYVLPMAIPQRTRVALAQRDDRVVRAWSTLKEGAPEEYRLGEEARGRGWLDFVQGVTQALARAGFPVRGFDLRVESDVPLGGGLSSSAALEVALLRALRDAHGHDLDDVALALLGQRAENDLVGVPVGMMDQMASSLADEETALFLDTRTLAWERIPLPAAAAIAVVDSGISHDLSDGAYAARRDECVAAAKALGVPSLRDCGLDDLPRVDRLPEPLRRRARHVVTENARVLEAVECLRAGDLVRLGSLLDASHASLRDDYEVSVPPVDALVEVARRQPGAHGARITGGGFGGSIVILTDSGAAARVAQATVDAGVPGARAAVRVPAPERP